MGIPPFFPYFGSAHTKASNYPEPQHDDVREPFAGSAGYSLRHNVRRAHLIDADPVIAGLWAYLIKATPEDILALPELPNVGDHVDNYDIPQEAKWLIGFWLNRGSASPKKSRTAYSARTDRSQLNWGARAKDRIASNLEHIRGWTVQHGSYESAPDVDATWFIDPPYVEKGKYYRVPFNRHDELGVWTKTRRGLVIAIEGPNAHWLPFQPLGSFKTSLGRSDEFVFVQGNRRDLFTTQGAL